MPPFRLGLVIPAYNEVRRLPPTLAAVATARDVLPSIELRAVLVAENGSTDGTAEAALAAAADLGLPLEILPVRGRGKGAAVRAGVCHLAARSDLDGILFMDADNATDLRELARFPLITEPGLWIASRHEPDSTIVHLGASTASLLARRFLSLGARLAGRVLLGLRFRDTQCGFKLVSAAEAKGLFGALTEEGWMMDAELLARAQGADLPITVVGVRWVEQGESKVRPVADGLGSFLGLLRIRRTLVRERAMRRHHPPA